MKSPQQIKDEYAKEWGMREFSQVVSLGLKEDVIDTIARRYAEEVKKEAARIAHDNLIGDSFELTEQSILNIELK